MPTTDAVTNWLVKDSKGNGKDFILKAGLCEESQTKKIFGELSGWKVCSVWKYKAKYLRGKPGCSLGNSKKPCYLLAIDQIRKYKKWRIIYAIKDFIR